MIDSKELLIKAKQLEAQGVDVEQHLFDILGEEIDKEFTATGQLTSKEHDAMIIAEMIRMRKEDSRNDINTRTNGEAEKAS